MATNTVGIDKEVEVNRKENLRDHRLYWIGRRTQDVILSSLALVVLSPVMLLLPSQLWWMTRLQALFLVRNASAATASPSSSISSAPCAPTQRQSWTICWIRTRWMVLCSKSRTTPALPVWASLSARPAR